MRALRRNPARRVAEREIWTVIAIGALCCSLAVAATVALGAGSVRGDGDGDLVVLVGALTFGVSVHLADRWRRHRR